jgi:hypothetical protein
MSWRSITTLVLLSLLGGGCRAIGIETSPRWTFGYHTSGLSVLWNPIERSTDEVSFDGVEIRPAGSVRVERAVLEFRTRSGTMLARTEARPVPADSFIHFGPTILQSEEELVSTLAIFHSRSTEPVTIELR